MTRDFELDQVLYEELLKSVASMTLLFSNGPQAYIDYHFIEKLFVLASRGRDISRSDKVFDAIVGSPQSIGVGVKTFVVSGNSTASMEKVQEFTSYSGSGAFNNLGKREIALKASEYRNTSIEADCKEYGIDLAKSIYHCLVRTDLGAVIHEEPYPLIDVANIRPIDGRGNEILDFPEGDKSIRFTDGQNIYSYSRSKSVLMKKFDLSMYSTTPAIPLAIDQDIWHKMSKSKAFESNSEAYLELLLPEAIDEEISKLVPGIDYVVLPLYSTRQPKKSVSPASGINQWNAAGRPRKYGEAYIPIPAKVHELASGFFPDREILFNLLLPNSANPIIAKVCQDNGKALMSNPNDRLCRWLYEVIDPNFKESDFDRPPNRQPFTYDDLLKVGRDSVMVVKVVNEDSFMYEIRFAEIDSYEVFLESFPG